jgi:hypothetical protein
LMSNQPLFFAVIAAQVATWRRRHCPCSQPECSELDESFAALLLCHLVDC